MRTKTRSKVAAGTILKVKPEYQHYAIPAFLRVEGFYPGIPTLAYCQPGNMIECSGIWAMRELADRYLKWFADWGKTRDAVRTASETDFWTAFRSACIC